MSRTCEPCSIRLRMLSKDVLDYARVEDCMLDLLADIPTIMEDRDLQGD